MDASDNDKRSSTRESPERARSESELKGELNGEKLAKLIKTLHRRIIRLYDNNSIPLQRHFGPDLVPSLEDDIITGYGAPLKALSLGKEILLILERHAKIAESAFDRLNAIVHELEGYFVPESVIDACQEAWMSLDIYDTDMYDQTDAVRRMVADLEEVLEEQSVKEGSALARSGGRWGCTVM